MTQATAASAEESSSAAEELTSQAEQLRALAIEFELGSGARSGRSRADRSSTGRARRSTQPTSTRPRGGNGSRRERVEAVALSPIRIAEEIIPFDTDDDDLQEF